MSPWLLWFLLAAPAAQTSGAQLFDEVWQTINDAYYDPTFGGLDVAAVRAELRPKAAAAASPGETLAVITEMLGRLKQSHFALLAAGGASSEFTLRGTAMVPIDIRPIGRDVVITRVAPGSSAERAGLEAGQVISAVDHVTLTAPAAGESSVATWRRANAVLHGGVGTTAELVITTPNLDVLYLSAPREIESGERVQFSNLPPMSVRVDARALKTPSGKTAGLIGFNLWMAAVDEPVARAVDQFRSSDGLIFDLRGNPGGLAGMIIGMAGHVLDTPGVIGTMRTRQVPKLECLANPRRSTPDGRSVVPFAGPVAILVDELTASASECFAGGLQDLGRARIFGRTSMGAALPASTKRLSNGDVLEYVVGDFITSRGRSLEGTGVVPDESQPLSIASLAAGSDDPLKAALAWIDKVDKVRR